MLSGCEQSLEKLEGDVEKVSRPLFVVSVRRFRGAQVHIITTKLQRAHSNIEIVREGCFRLLQERALLRCCLFESDCV